MKADYPSIAGEEVFRRLYKPCPYFKHGLCTAPSLCKPTDVYIVKDRCLTILHETCRIYMLAKENKMFERCLWKGSRYG